MEEIPTALELCRVTSHSHQEKALLARMAVGCGTILKDDEGWVGGESRGDWLNDSISGYISHNESLE